MREILFRGKVRGNYNDYHSVIKDKGWLYGDLHIGSAIYIHIDGDEWRLRVEPETVGQFTGLLDNNGNKIFEGDIIQVMLPNNKPKRDFIAYVLWDSAFSGFRLSKYDYFVNSNSYGFEIIGNIHDNKELLK